MFPLANASLPRSSFLCHLTERLVSFSVRVFAQMWAPRTLWHAWGLPMRLDGDSDTAARPNDLQNRRRGLEKGCSQPYTWLTEALFALLSCYSALLFVFAEISGLLVSNSDHEIWRADFISSIFFIFFVWNTLNDKLGSVSGRRINSRVTLLLLTDWLTWLKIVEKHYLSLKKIQWSASKKLKMLDLLASKAWSHKQPGGSWLSLFAFPYRDTLSVCA